MQLILTGTYLEINGTKSGNFSNPVKFHVKENAGFITICVMLVGEFPRDATAFIDDYFTIDGSAGKLCMCVYIHDYYNEHYNIM